MSSHNDTVLNFAARKINRRSGLVEWRGHNVYCEGKTLFSYGRHFALAIYMGEKDGKHLFLKNGDKYSSSTSQHQAMVQSACDGPTLSFSALGAALRWSPSCIEDYLKMSFILDFTQDTRIEIVRNVKSGEVFHRRYDYTEGREVVGDAFQKPVQGMAIWGKKSEGEQWVSGIWHILGGVVFRVPTGMDMERDTEWRYFLSGVDEGSYFLCELPGEANTVTEAYQILKPIEVKVAEANGQAVQRQGEWFFVPTDLTDQKLAEIAGQSVTAFRKSLQSKALPDNRPNRRNTHDCKQMVLGEDVLCKGRVFHRNTPTWRFDVPATLSGEHKTVHLGEVWHLAYRNTELNSWGTNGKVD